MSGAPGVPRRRRLLLRFAVLLGAPPAVLTAEAKEAGGPMWAPILTRASILFAPIAVAVTAGFFLTYLVVTDTTYRSAFSPQVQAASDAAAKLDAGADPRSVVPAYTIDMADSLYPYVIVLDRSGRPLASSALLDGRQPVLPAGIMDYLRTGVERHDSTWYAVYAGTESWIMWTPRSGVTTAMVVQSWRDGFVVAGRSADGPTAEFAAAWALTLVATAMVCLFIGLVHPMAPKSPPPSDDGGGGSERDPPPPPRPRERRPHGFRPIVRPRPRARPRSRA